MQKKLLVPVCGLALVIAFGISSAARTDPRPASPQDAIRLEQRINQLEQRLYSIETSLRSVEQQSRLSGGTSRGVEDLSLLRSQIQTLQVRLLEYECALAKLDERTLTPAMREARRKAGASDPCRSNVDTPVRLSEWRQ